MDAGHVCAKFLVFLCQLPWMDATPELTSGSESAKLRSAPPTNEKDPMIFHQAVHTANGVYHQRRHPRSAWKRVCSTRAPAACKAPRTAERMPSQPSTRSTCGAAVLFGRWDWHGTRRVKWPRMGKA